MTPNPAHSRCGSFRGSTLSRSDRYTDFEHRHRFATWAAARAAQRGFLKSAILYEAIEHSGVKDTLESGDWPKSAAAVDAKHRLWCGRMIQFWRTKGVAKGTYGRAAKLLNVYLKCMLVVGPHLRTPFARLAHPPIDRILLKALARSATTRRDFGRIDWTKLDQNRYFALIRALRAEKLDRPAFWRIEEHWKPR